MMRNVGSIRKIGSMGGHSHSDILNWDSRLQEVSETDEYFESRLAKKGYKKS